MMTAILRGAIAVAAIALAIAGPSFAQYPSCDDATVLALELSGELVAPADVVAQIARDLAIIRGAYPVVDAITVWRDWVPGALLVGLTDPAWVQYLAGTFTALDALNNEYGLTIVDQNPTARSLVLASQECSNPTVMVDAYWARPEVMYVEPSYYIGDGDDIMSTELGWYTFKRGWGDCAAGCDYYHYWQFRVINNAATIVSESGDALSDETSTFGAVKALFR